jgi:hypothetical protein
MTVSILVGRRMQKVDTRFGTPRDTLGQLAPYQLRE